MLLAKNQLWLAQTLSLIIPLYIFSDNEQQEAKQAASFCRGKSYGRWVRNMSRNWIFTESFSVLCLVDIKKKRNFAAYFYVDTIKYSVKQWFLNEKHIWITLWDARGTGW